MSFQAVGWAVKQQIVTSPTDRFVLVILASHAGSEGDQIFPSADRVALETGLSVRTVRQARQRLMAAGVIEATGEKFRRVPELRVVEADDPPNERPLPSAAPYPLLSAAPNQSGTSQEGGKDLANASSKSADPVESVWDEYVRVMAPRRKQLDTGERRTIREALAVASVEECQAAIRGCKASSFHMGQNSRGRTYKTLSHILRGKRGERTTREQIDLFLDVAEKAGAASGVASAAPEKVTMAKRAVIDAWEFPGEEQVQERGKKAEAWLRDNGWLTERGPGDAGRPRFLPQMGLNP